jgi:hypothetical protein
VGYFWAEKLGRKYFQNCVYAEQKKLRTIQGSYRRQYIPTVSANWEALRSISQPFEPVGKLSSKIKISASVM